MCHRAVFSFEYQNSIASATIRENVMFSEHDWTSVSRKFIQTHASIINYLRRNCYLNLDCPSANCVWAVIFGFFLFGMSTWMKWRVIPLLNFYLTVKICIKLWIEIFAFKNRSSSLARCGILIRLKYNNSTVGILSNQLC